MDTGPRKTVSYDRAAMRELAIAEVATLKLLDASKLQGLPACAVRHQSGVAPVTINQYHEASEMTGEHKVVVQVSRDAGFGFWEHREIDGFVIAADGSQRDLTAQEKLLYR